MESSSSEQIQQALEILKECEQTTLLEELQKRSSEEQQRLAAQVIHLNKVTPGGMKDYVFRARRFLEDSKNNVNPFANYKPEIPTGVNLKPGTDLFSRMEEKGLRELSKLGFVLIAGGLGERLGYSGIKIDLPVCLIEPGYTYLKYYIQYIHACRERALHYLDESVNKEEFYVPLCIMVSDDTIGKTLALLEANNYYGMKKEHVDIVKQENVPALIDNSGAIAIDDKEFKIVTKPHGHGDIHTLLYQFGVAQKWQKMGKEWMLFFQDTNAVALKVIPSILGVSRENNWQMNSVTVPRKPGESMGAICKLVDQTNPAKEIEINVEYNQLDPLLRAKWNEKGDIPNENGFSYFPGNTNTLVFKLTEYVQTLEETKGVIPEFVNPKYADESRTTFKAPTRLECMMQDYPKLVTTKGAVGFTNYDTWYCFSPAKNNLKDASVLFNKGMPSYGPSQAEYDFYNWTNNILEQIGVKIERQDEATDFGGLKLAFGPKILLDPTFAITYDELVQKFEGENKISKNSTLILAGKETRVKDFILDGTVEAKNGETLQGDHSNHKFVKYTPTDESDAEVYRIRGYKVQKQE